MSWPLMKLLDCCDVSTGKYDANHGVTDGSFPFYTCAEKPIAANTYSFDGDSIILPGNGANVGLVLFYSGKFEAYQRTYVLNSFKKDVYSRYVFHHLSKFWRLRNERAQFGSATNYIRMQNFGDYEIPLPPLEEQKRIAAILDKADAIHRKRQQAIKLADDFLRSVFLEMFGDPVTNPKGFNVGTIRDLVETANYGSSAKASSKDGEYPMLRMGNITYEGAIDLTDLKYVDLEEKDKPKYLAAKGDLLFNRTNSKELVGKAAVYDLDKPVAIAGYLIRVRTNSKGNNYYISGYLNSSHGKTTLQNMCKSIVGMANINAQEMQNIPIFLPPLELQEKYQEIFVSTKKKVSVQYESLKHISSLFDSLNKKAFLGEL